MDGIKVVEKTVFFVMSAFLAIIGSVIPWPDTVEAAEKTEHPVIYEEGDFRYTLNEDGETVTVKGYLGYELDVEIPDTIAGRLVTGMDYSEFEGEHMYKSIFLPKSLETIEGAEDIVLSYSFLTDIFVADDNEVYASEDGILYNKEKTELILCPRGRCGEVSNLPQSLKSIGDYSFFDCEYLTFIRLPDGVTRIGKRAFSRCEKLENVLLPEGLESIEDYAFYGCWELEDISLPKRLENIGDSAFGACVRLEDVSFPEKLKLIGSYAFSSCSRLTDIKLPDGVEMIGNCAFTYCERLRTVYLPENLCRMGNDVFEGCNRLTDIYYPKDEDSFHKISMGTGNGETKYRKMHFMEIDGYEYRVLEDGTVEITGCHVDKEATIVVPWELGGKKVTGIGENAFINYASENYFGRPISIELPAGIRSIGDKAFYNGYCLVSISLPEGIESIGECAFYNCKRLKSIELPKSVTCIGKKAFYGCKSLVGICLPEGIGSIEERTFENCVRLEGIELPKGVSSIGKAAFQKCAALKCVEMSEGVSNIECNVFYGCGSLTDITLPKSLVGIGKDAFYGCESLEDVYFPKSKNSWDTLFVGSGNEDLRLADIHVKGERVKTL